MEEMYPVVQIELMRKALTAFNAAYRKFGPKRWSGKAEDAVFKVVQGERLHASISYLKRCHGIRNLIKDRVPKSLRIWVLPDGSLHDALLAAVALAPLRPDGKFRIKELEATAEKIARESLSGITAGTA